MSPMQHTCATCGVTFVARPQARYCSRRCRSGGYDADYRDATARLPAAAALTPRRGRAARAPVPRRAQCGQPFTPPRNPGRYCSALAASGRFGSARRRHDPQPPLLRLLWRGLRGHGAGALLLAAVPQPRVQRAPPRGTARLRAAATARAPPGRRAPVRSVARRLRQAIP